MPGIDGAFATRLTISTYNPEDLNRIKQIIADYYRIIKIKGPTVTEKGRMNFYIFLGDDRQTVNYSS